MSKKEEQDFFYLNLGQEIRKARQALKISQEELADHLELSRVSIVNIEKGRQKVQVHTLLQVGQYLKVSIDHLLHVSMNQKIDKAIIKEISSDKTVAIKRIKEFYFKVSKTKS